jgi:hypothetical protein
MDCRVGLGAKSVATGKHETCDSPIRNPKSPNKSKGRAVAEVNKAQLLRGKPRAVDATRPSPGLDQCARSE